MRYPAQGLLLGMTAVHPSLEVIRLRNVMVEFRFMLRTFSDLDLRIDHLGGVETRTGLTSGGACDFPSR